MRQQLDNTNGVHDDDDKSCSAVAVRGDVATDCCCHTSMPQFDS